MSCLYVTGLWSLTAEAASGEMWSWGKGPALGHRGHDHSQQQLLPKVIEGLPPGASILRIAAGGQKAAYVRADGTTLCWGKFLHETATTSTPTLLE